MILSYKYVEVEWLSQTRDGHWAINVHIFGFLGFTKSAEKNTELSVLFICFSYTRPLREDIWAEMNQKLTVLLLNKLIGH